MRFTCASADLMNGLSIATRALSARSPLPIFEGVLLESCDQGLKLTCSDSSLSIVTRVSATIEAVSYTHLDVYKRQAFFHFSF